MKDKHLEQASTWLSAQQWQRIVPLIQRNPRHGGNAGGDNRLFVEAVLCHIRTGTSWRSLPAEFGAWNSIYIRYKRWSEKKVWQRIFQALADDADFRAVYLNDTVLELHRKSADAGMHASSRVLALLESQLAPPAPPGSAAGATASAAL
jgi:putative transposase